jgi:hypothetical protein
MRIELAAPRLPLLAGGPFAVLAGPADPDNRRLPIPKRAAACRAGAPAKAASITRSRILAVSSGHVQPPSLSRQRTRTVRLIWESHANRKMTNAL